MNRREDSREDPKRRHVCNKEKERNEDGEKEREKTTRDKEKVMSCHTIRYCLNYL